MVKMLKKAGELGFLGIGVPTEYGGLGMGFNTVMHCKMQMGAYSYEFSTAQVAHTTLGTLPILLYGNEEQKKKYLPKIVTGELLTCYCLTEP